jgi:hypothetical protein
MDNISNTLLKKALNHKGHGGHKGFWVLLSLRPLCPLCESGFFSRPAMRKLLTILNAMMRTNTTWQQIGQTASA